MATSSTSVSIKPTVSGFNDCISEDFDYIVIGSSFCALGFVEQLLKNNCTAKMLIIEKGSYCSDIESLSPADLGEKEKKTEEQSWKFKTADENGIIKEVRGVNCYVGGRSSFWKAWCPKPTREEMTGWPGTVIKLLDDYFPRAKELLSVNNVDKIEGDQFNRLQEILFSQLEPLQPQPLQLQPLHTFTAITRVENAPLALVERNSEYGSHQKFSVVDSLRAKIKKFDNVKLLTECEVSKIIMDQDKASGLVTSKGTLPLGQAKLILAMSALPSTILTLNSLSPAVHGIGTRFTGHFATYIFARVPCEGNYAAFALDPLPEHLELAAFYIAGVSEKSRHQFHIQLNAVSIAGNEKPNLDKMRHLLKTPKDEMIETCHNHIVFVCATLGQVDHNNPNNQFYLDETTGQQFLHFTANDTDKELWDTMDRTTFQVLEHLSPNQIEYWNSDFRKWQEGRPSKDQIQHKSLVHPASTMWISNDASSPVSLDYTVRGMDNVYLTGGALWPTAGSWNPTCAMTALAMHLADCLTAPNSKL